MGAVASITIVVDEKGAVKALDNITGAAQALPSAFQKAGSTGNVVLTKLTEDHKKANESVRLLTESLGIGIPRALQNVITSSALARSALSSVFTVGAVAAFASVAIDTIDSIRNKIDEFSEEHSLTARMFGLDSVNRERFHSALKQEEQLALQTQLATASDMQKVQLRVAADLKEIDKDIESAHVTGGARAEEELARLRIARQREAAAELIEIDRKTSDATRQIQNQADLAALTGIDAITKKKEQSIAEQELLAKRDEAVRAALAQRVTAIEKLAEAEILKAKQNAAAQGIVAVLQAEAAGATGKMQIEKEYEAALKQTQIEQLTSNILLSDKLKAIAIDRYSKIKELDRQRLDELRDLETQTAIAILPPWQRANAEIVADTDKRIHEIEELMKKDKYFQAQGAHEIALVQMQEFAKLRDNLADTMESTFDDITSGNIGKRFKKMFEDMVFQMVATWILGMQGMRAASAGAMGGGTGGILGALFGIGGGGAGGGIFGGGSAPGGTPPFLGGGIMNLFGRSSSGGLGSSPLISGGNGADAASVSMFGLGISAGQGANIPGAVLPAGSAPGGAAGGIGGLLGKLFPNGLKIGGMNISGAMLASGGLALAVNGIGRGGVLGAFEGAVGGALTGLAIGGPIGAAIGWTVGLFSSIIGGLFGEHKGDKARKQVMEPLIAQIRVIKDSYDVFQTDYNSGVTELEQLRSDAISKIRQIGGNQVGGNTRSTNKLVDDAEAYMKTTEAERARRGQLNFGPPQFHAGGMVTPELAYLSPGIPGARRYHRGGEVNANLLVGEGVLTPTGVRAVGGAAGLNRLNSGDGASPEVHNHYYINAIDAKSFDEFLRAGGMKAVKSNIALEMIEGRW